MRSKKSRETDERSTPDNLFLPLDEEFRFTLDPCSTHENAKCERHYTRKENGLLQSWRDEIVFMNPPYSNIPAWLFKARFESDVKNATIVAILPCDTSPKWFHDFIWIEELHETRTGVQLRFPKGRFKFGYTTTPKFATIIAIFKPLNSVLEKTVSHPNPLYAALKK